MRVKDLIGKGFYMVLGHAAAGQSPALR